MPNILLLIADDLGRDLGCLGNTVIRSPNLDQLAAEGTLFLNAFASTASCSGSRSTIYTGRHTHGNGQYGLGHGYNHFETFAGIPTAPALFNTAGWHTGIIGKVHVGPDATYPWQQRIDNIEPRDVRLMADRLRDFLARDRTKPFFMTMGYTDPHRHGDASGFGNAPDYRDVERRVYDPAKVPVPTFLPDIPEVRAELAEYHQAVDRLDQGVGMAIDELRRDGRLDDTLIIFVSDNGIPFINSKTTLFDAGTRLPLIVKRPGQRSGIQSTELVSFVDILPTLLGYAGIALPTGLHGHSFLDLLGAEKSRARDRVYCSHTFHEVTNYWPTRVVRTQRWKYHRNVAWQLDFPFAMDLYESKTWTAIAKRGDVHIGQRPILNYVRRPYEQLFDIQADPNEITDLTSDPACASVLAELRADLDAWQVATDDPWIMRDGVSALNRMKRGASVPSHPELRWAGKAVVAM